MKVGLIGAGQQGKRRASVLKGSGDATLVIIADTNMDKAQLLADEVGCQATTEWQNVTSKDDTEAVLVCTPPHLHAQMSIAAMKAGKHVLCEKPLGKNLAEAEEMVAIAQQSGVKLKCGFNLRHHPGIQQARKWLNEGIIGETIFIQCRYGICGRPDYDKDWRMNPDISGGGQLMDQGMHALDLSRWFLGDFTEAFGSLQTGFWSIAPLEDNAFTILRTERGQVAYLHVSWTQWKNLFSLEIVGQDGYITIEGLGGSYGVEKATIGKRAFLKPFAEEITEYRGQDNSWHEEWNEFICAIREDREPLGNGYDGLQVLKLALAIYDSARMSKVVKL